MEGGPPGHGHCPWHGRGRLGVAPLEEGPVPRRRPPAHQGEGVAHRLRRRAPDRRRAARRHGASPGRGASRRPRRRLPPLRQPRRGAVQGRPGPAHSAGPRHAPTRRSGAVRGAQRPGGPRGRLPLAPARRRRRDAPGGALRREGAQPLGEGRQGRGAGGRHHRRSQAGHPLPRRPAPPPPPLRRTHPHGQVHAHAPRRRPQDAREGGGQGRRRHRRRGPPHRPGGRADGARPRGSHRPGAPHRPLRRDPLPRREPPGHEDICRPRPHRRLGGARGEGAVGAVGAEDAVHPRTDGQDPPRGKRAGGGGGSVHDPRRPQAAVQRAVPQGRAQEGLRPLPPGVVGQHLHRLEPRLQGRLPGPRPDPAVLLRIVKAGKGHPRPAPLHHRPAPDRSTTAGSCWYRRRRGPSAGTWPPWWARPS